MILPLIGGKEKKNGVRKIYSLTVNLRKLMCRQTEKTDRQCEFKLVGRCLSWLTWECSHGLYILQSSCVSLALKLLQAKFLYFKVTRKDTEKYCSFFYVVGKKKVCVCVCSCLLWPEAEKYQLLNGIERQANRDAREREGVHLPSIYGILSNHRHLFYYITESNWPPSITCNVLISLLRVCFQQISLLRNSLELIDREVVTLPGICVLMIRIER